LIRRLFSETFHREEELVKQQSPVSNFDWKTIVILVWTAIGMAIIRYYGNPRFFAEILEDRGFKESADELREWVTGTGYTQLHHLGWWVGTMFLVYFFVPLLLVRFVFKEPLANYGLSFKGAFKQWWLYALMLAIMIPLVVFFSTTKSFQDRYPFYNPAYDSSLWPNFWMWEAMYFGQFIALEFFFRGFMTLGLRHRFGYYSIFVMTIPYCMIHFGKPMPETIGAIIAGIILGTLSMKSRSIWLGVLIHYSIAITMDLCSLWRKDML
jgi:uncharacterized protein